ncbi:FUSC family protein [Paraburkholderia sp. J11-2]|uniref:FUSC family protein n=1 Tax=Paraburkholderia sp. J11-2 TaxID=2805431 RepID=UPI002AB6C8ED|nr:FUSC family protein [Paraburkholderia sp. J11-2]
MTTTGPFSGELSTITRFFKLELADYPGRMAWTLRLLLIGLLLVLISMTLGVPYLVLSIGAVAFNVVQPNVVLTRLVGMTFVISTFVVVATILLVLKFAYGYPMVRIVVSSLIFLACMYLMRVHKLGIVFFAVAVAVLIGQTTPDTLDYPEIAVRSSMWMGMSFLYPVIVIWIVYGWFFPAEPLRQLQEEVGRQISDIAARLERGATPEGGTTALTQGNLDAAAGRLQKLHGFAAMRSARYRSAQAYWKVCIDAVSYMHGVICSASGVSELGSGDHARRLLASLRDQVEALNRSFIDLTPYRSDWKPTAEEADQYEQLGLGGVCRALQELARLDPAQLTMPPARKGGMFVPDAFTNPAYLRFALKTLLASLICYVFYHSVDWDGIHTSMITCGLVANPTQGATSRKLILRFGGALMGGALALLCSVTVLPRIDDIVSLLLMAAPVFFVGAWIAAGSERSSYIGIQMVATFCIAVMADQGPNVDLTEIRDRAMGIWIGTAVSAVVYTMLWPESEAGTLRQKLVDLVRQLGRLVAQPIQGAADEQLHYLQQREACHMAIVACEETRNRVFLEDTRPHGERRALLENGDQVLEQSRAMLQSWDALRDGLAAQREGDATQRNSTAWQERVQARLQRYAEGMAGEPAEATHVLFGRDDAIEVPPLAAKAERLMDDIRDLPEWGGPQTGAPLIYMPGK